MATEINEKTKEEKTKIYNKVTNVEPTVQHGNTIPTYKTTKAQKIFNSKDSNNHNSPKPKSLYYVFFKLNNNFINAVKSYDEELSLLTLENLQKMSYDISKLVKEYDKPSITIEQSELNEYNRKRFIYKNIKYGDVKIKFFDVRNSIVQKLFFKYLKAINNDLCNQLSSESIQNLWHNEIDSFDLQPVNHNYGLTIDSNEKLFNEISFCEYYDNYLTVYTIINPKIKDIKFGNGKMGDFDSNDIEVSFSFETVLNNLYGNVSTDGSDSTINESNIIGSEIKSKQLANFLQLRYCNNRPEYGEQKINENMKYNPDVNIKERKTNKVVDISKSSYDTNVLLDIVQRGETYGPPNIKYNPNVLIDTINNGKNTNITNYTQTYQPNTQAYSVQNGFVPTERNYNKNRLLNNIEQGNNPTASLPQYKVEMYDINKKNNKSQKVVFGDAWSMMKAYMNKDVDFSWNTVKNQALDTARKYGFAEEANALSQAELSFKLMKNKSFKDNIKYAINAIGDPTTFIGNTQKSTSGMANNIISKIGGWFK